MSRANSPQRCTVLFNINVVARTFSLPGPTRRDSPFRWRDSRRGEDRGGLIYGERLVRGRDENRDRRRTLKTATDLEGDTIRRMLPQPPVRIPSTRFARCPSPSIRVPRRGEVDSPMHSLVLPKHVFVAVPEADASRRGFAQIVSSRAAMDVAGVYAKVATGPEGLTLDEAAAKFANTVGTSSPGTAGEHRPDCSGTPSSSGGFAGDARRPPRDGEGDVPGGPAVALSERRLPTAFHQGIACFHLADAAVHPRDRRPGVRRPTG